MITQLDLPVKTIGKIKPAAADLAAYLKGAGWLTAKEISQRTGWDDRAIRELASQSEDIISAPGLPGYKHINDCTVAEYHQYRSARLSQADAMRAKVILTDRRFFNRAPVQA